MKPSLRVLGGNASGPNAGLGFEGRILRLVKGAPELRAIESGQVDAVIDPATGRAFLLPDAQQALREDQARNRSLFALSADWIWELDESYRFISHSSTAAGNAAPYDEGIIGKRPWELPFDMDEADWKVHRKLLEWRTTFRDLELRCTGRAGEVRYVSFSGEPIFGREDKFTGYRGITRDITEPRRVAPIPGNGASRAVVSRETTVGRKRPEEQLPGLEQNVATQDRIANSLLAALPRKDYLGLLGGLEPVKLTYGTVLYEPGELITHVFFPVDCLVSLLTTVEGHHAMEVGLVGREGMVGISLALGMDVSSVRALVQGTGTAMRMKAARFHKGFEQCLPLRRELYRYTYAKLAMARQTVACNQFHAVEARLARWLLMTSDRVLSEEFLLTQAFLADMLGVRRAGVNEAAGSLQQRKLIRYSRGKIRILDRTGLEAASCRCYARIEGLHGQ
jgi:PAS domain S-box-containing protein